MICASLTVTPLQTLHPDDLQTLLILLFIFTYMFYIVASQNILHYSEEVNLFCQQLIFWKENKSLTLLELSHTCPYLHSTMYTQSEYQC